MKRLRSERLIEAAKEIVFRFPLTIAYILLATYHQLTFNEFFFGDDPMQFVYVFGMILSGVAQLIYERFYKDNPKIRWLLYGGVIGLSILYYIFVNASFASVDRYWTFYSMPGIRTMILLFVTTIAFIWVPTIKSKVKFSSSFLVVFRSFFANFFFSALLFAGIMTTISLFEFLFFSLNTDWFTNTGIIIFYLLFPVMFLTSVPNYHLYEEEIDIEELTISKFLKLLITFVFIPVMIILSIIIVLYIITNLTSDFFGESLIEGLTLSYTISGWIILLLADSLEHSIAKWFRRIFPYALLFVIILQMISTFIQIRDVGVTHGRYLILLFGVGSIVSGVWYLMKKQDLRILPMVAIAAGVIALIPPIDAVGLSVRQQRNRIDAILEEHGMFVGDNEVEPNADVPSEDQEEVVESLRYLSSINALNQLGWLPDESYYKAESYLGFTEGLDSDYGYGNQNVESLDVMIAEEEIHLPIEAFNHFYDISLNDSIKTYQGKMGEETIDVLFGEDEFVVELTPADSDTPVPFDFSFIFDEFNEGAPFQGSAEELTFTVENEGREVKLVIQQLYQYGDSLSVHFYLFI